MTDRGYNNVAVIAPNYPAGKDAITGFKRFYKGAISDEIYTKLGQLDYAAELAQIRAAKPQAVYVFLPGGMGVNFIKQYVAAGLNQTIVLVGPGFTADEDIIKAVGEPMVGMYNTSQWAHDLDNPPTSASSPTSRSSINACPRCTHRRDTTRRKRSTPRSAT